MKTNLKSCPFCGGDAQMDVYNPWTAPQICTATVKCMICGAIVGVQCKSEEEARVAVVTKWNREWEANGEQ